MIPFVGPSYLLKRKLDVERSVNMLPAPIESGSAPMFLKQIPGLIRFSDDLGAVIGEGSFVGDYLSHSCNYGFFGRPGGGFLLVTDTFGSDRDGSFASPEGWYLKLQRVNADGSISTSVVSSLYVTNGVMETYLYDGFVYAGFVTEISSGNRGVIVKIDLDTLAVTEAYKYLGPVGLQPVRAFDLIAAPGKVMFNTYRRTVSDSIFIVVDLATGAEDLTVTLPFALDYYPVGHVSQEVIGGPWFVGGKDQFAYALLRCNLTTGAVIDTYSITALFGSQYRMHTVKRAGSSLLLFARLATGDLQRYRMGVFNTTSNTVTGVADIVGKPHELDFPLYDPVRNTVFFVATEETLDGSFFDPPVMVAGQARVYGYSLDTLTMEYDYQLPLEFLAGEDISSGTAPFTGFVGGDGYIYVSHYTGLVMSGGFSNEQYKVFRLSPP